MNYAAIKKTDVANGPGIRVSLFVSGCPHACKGCFNQEAWDFHYGQEYTDRTEAEILQALAPDYIRGFSALGGEPLAPQNRGTVLGLLRKIRREHPKKDIWCYTGYDYEQELLPDASPEIKEILSLIDILVDGRFIEEKKNLRLPFRGSENQRLIDIKASGRQGGVVIFRSSSDSPRREVNNPKLSFGRKENSGQREV